MKIKSMIACLLLAMMLLSGCGTGNKESGTENSRQSAQQSDSAAEVSNALPVKEVLPKEAKVEFDPDGSYGVGDIVVFGQYAYESLRKDPLEWIVLETDGNTALMMTRRVISKGRFKSKADGITTNWADCEVRTFLNEEFLADAFDANAQRRVIKTHITTEGMETDDRVWILSEEECEAYIPQEQDRTAKVTPYAMKEYYNYFGNNEDYGTVMWLLRDHENADYVNIVGREGYFEEYLQNDSMGIRPVVRVDLGTDYKDAPPARVGVVSIQQNQGTRDIVTFGRIKVWQDETQDLQWQVLYNDGKYQTMICTNIIHPQVYIEEKDVNVYVTYHSEAEAVSWKDCWIRNVLNTQFVEEWFTEEERSKIIPIETEQDSYDKVWLLNAEEVESCFRNKSDRAAEVLGGGIKSWILRGDGENHVLYVHPDGPIYDTSGINLYAIEDYNYAYYRPVITISVE